MRGSDPSGTIQLALAQVIANIAGVIAPARAGPRSKSRRLAPIDEVSYHREP